MLMFAILYFDVMIDAGLFDLVVGRIWKPHFLIAHRGEEPILEFHNAFSRVFIPDSHWQSFCT